MIVAGHDEQVDQGNAAGAEGDPPEGGRYPFPDRTGEDAELDALALRAARGDRRAVEELLRRIDRHVLRYCRARMSGRSIGCQTPEDAAQEVMVAICGAMKRFRSDGTHFMAFVHGIIRNKVTDTYRAAGRDHSDPVEQVPDGIDDDVDGPETAALRQVDRELLRRLLGELSPQQREILVLRVAMGHSAEETARLTGSTPGAVRVSQHRTLIRLRAMLRDRGAEMEERWSLPHPR